MYIIQVYIDDRLLCLGGIAGHIQKIRVDAWLFFDIIRQQIVFRLEMMIEASVRDAGFFANVLDGELFIPLFL